MNNNDKNTKKNLIIIVLIIIILLLLYFLIRRFGYIENHGLSVPTGNVDIFEIDCNCDICKETDKPVFNEDSDVNKNKSNNGSTDKKQNTADITVFDNYKIWDNKELRIFSNPAYEYESKIAPRSSNSYTFIIRNNNNFDVVVDINFIEENKKNINMQYKLKSYGKYLVGNENEYVKFDNYKIERITISAKSQIPYILDWKWIDSENDTEIGFDINSSYKLSIQIGAN